MDDGQMVIPQSLNKLNMLKSIYLKYQSGSTIKDQFSSQLDPSIMKRSRQIITISSKTANPCCKPTTTRTLTSLQDVALDDTVGVDRQ